MKEDRFEHLMRDAAHTFRNPPTPDFEAMWDGVTREVWGEDRVIASSPIAQRGSPYANRSARYLAIAATLVIGIALGRASTAIGTKASSSAETVASTAMTPAANIPYEAETSKYLGQTAALLIALPSEVRAGRANEQFVGRAGELLGRTRLLLDSPAANDPQMKNLLEDLELVLAQVVRLQNNSSSRTELDLIARTLEQHDVIPRLRTAVADTYAN
jgi:hypothetical protein